jgi:DNA-binding LacI/PurR family transcriptional regulator/signal transduction histidine kinase
MVKRYKRERPTIGVLAGWHIYEEGMLPNGYLSSLYKWLNTAARDQACNLLLACGMSVLTDLRNPAWPALEPESDFVPVGPWNTDGLIVILPLLTESRSHYLQQIQAEGHPVVFIGVGEGRPAVISDNESGIRQAIGHLVEHGHRRIAFIAGAQGDPGDTQVRLHAYQSALNDYGLEPDPALVGYGRHTQVGGAKVVQQLLAEGVSFTAILTSNDLSAFGALGALRDAGKRIPQDVAVIGFDDIPATVAQTPPLTSIYNPTFELASAALQLLLRYITGGENIPDLVKVPTQLVVRQSCGCWPGMIKPASRPAEAIASKEEAAVQAPLEQAMTEAVLAGGGHPDPVKVRSFCRQWVETFLLSLSRNQATAFQSALRNVLQRVETSDMEAYAWQGAIAVLAEGLPDLLESSALAERRQLAESLLYQAQVAVNESVHRQYSRVVNQQLAIADRVKILTSHFLGILDQEKILSLLAEYLPTTGIPHAEVIFFEGEDDDPVAWSVLALGPTGAPPRFASREFPPPGLYPAEQLFHLALLPLVFQKEALGFVVFNSDDLLPYATITQQLAVALKIARLHATEKENARKLEQAYRVLEENQAKLLVAEKMVSLGRLTSGIAHEMNTPLAAIRASLSGLSQLVKEYQNSITDPEVTPEDHWAITLEMQQAIQLAEKATGRAADFVRSIKSQTRIPGPQARQQFDAVPVVQDALVLLGYALRHANCPAKLEAPLGRAEMFGLPGRLAQVVTNLVTNAVEASTAKGGGPINVRLTPGPEGVELVISDQGSGIPPEVLPKIFDPMFTTKPFGEGTGLGLTIVHDIVTSEFGGTIDVESQVGEGTTFTIWLPRRTGVEEA